ncbi:MAG: prepilin-type N-terminal cleavage/methylation domain-containing protein [Oceanospirillaceae bacterium]|nr:prepilin-type N-terminal cleavage/methylation domain-containing protein [Oceanospirillaceae bacterium]
MKQRGFTLLEILIAIGITAVIGVAATQLLSGVADSRKTTDEHSDVLMELVRADMWIKRDLQQLAPRDIMDEFTSQQADITSQGDYPMEMTHAGLIRIPGADEIKRSTLQRVAYGVYHQESDQCAAAKKRIEIKHPATDGIAQPLDGNCLVRFIWPVLDRAADTKPISQVLIDNVSSVKFFYRGVIHLENNQQQATEWEETWPPLDAGPNDVTDLVLAKVVFELPTMGSIEHVIEVPRGYKFR